MNQIVPHLWFNKEAREATAFYVSLFDGSRIVRNYVMYDTPSGDVDAIEFELAGLSFEAISAGPLFKLNASISLMVACESKQEVDRLWAALSAGGTVMMDLDQYPFNPHYGWVADRFGLHWQLMLVQGAMPTQRITPNLLFSGGVNGKAEEAVRFYTSLMPNSSVSLVSHYAEGGAISKLAKANYIGFTLQGTDLSAMDNAMDDNEGFSEAFSLIIYCDTQVEIDQYWKKLSHVPEAEACGWLKDRYGLSWQVVPRVLGSLITEGTPEQTRRVSEAFMDMKKLDILKLQAVFDAADGA